MKPKESIFERAQALLASGSSKDCANVIEELRQLQSNEQAEADSVRPPGEKIFGGPGIPVGVRPPGELFQAAAEQDGAEGEAATADFILR